MILSIVIVSLIIWLLYVIGKMRYELTELTFIIWNDIVNEGCINPEYNKGCSHDWRHIYARRLSGHHFKIQMCRNCGQRRML